MFNLQFEKYLTKNGTISPNSPLKIRAEYYLIAQTNNHLELEGLFLSRFDKRPSFQKNFTGYTECVTLESYKILFAKHQHCLI